MAIWAHKETKVIVQGITGREGRHHTAQMLAYGTRIVGGVTPGKGGEWALDRIPIFDTVREACESTGATASILFVPPRAAVDAMYEAIDAGITLMVCLTENIPIQDMLQLRRHLHNSHVTLFGPASPGILVPGEVLLGVIPTERTMPGKVAIVARSSTLLYEAIEALAQHHIGQRICIGLGGDAVMGMDFVEALSMLEDDPQTEIVVLIGEIGGTAEQNAARFIRERMSKPVIAYIAGKYAPEEVRMGHGGAIIVSGVGLHHEKIVALQHAHVRIASDLEAIPSLLKALNPP
ncbi:MAG: succinate--CoA ligase subunit alpha [Anaerolineae bacterium]